MIMKVSYLATVAILCCLGCICYSKECKERESGYVYLLKNEEGTMSSDMSYYYIIVGLPTIMSESDIRKYILMSLSDSAAEGACLWCPYR